MGRTHPLSYRITVLLLAFGGYLYLLGLLLLVIAAAAFLALRLPILFIVPAFAMWVFGPFFVLMGIIVGALWVRAEAPQGYAIKRPDAPVLFALFDKIRRAARGPRVHYVMLNGEMNASVVQLPRLGVFGWNRIYLTIGLPLMQALSEDEFTAVLAHEYGHLAGKHGRFRCWVYRLRMTWWGIGQALQRGARWSRWLFTPFYALYVPYFNAYSFVLARADEYEADRMSAEIAGADAAARALLRVNTTGHYLNARFWPTLFKTANEVQEPPYLPLARLREEFGRPLAAADVSEGYNAALARSTDLSDTHPSPHDRLRAMGATVASMAPIESSAAEKFLGADLLSKIIDRLDTEWRSSMLEGGKNHYQRSREERQRLSQLNEKAKSEKLAAKERLRRAALTERFSGEDESMPLYREIVGAEPTDARAQFELGRVLVGRNEAEGLSILEEAARLDDRFTMAACELAYLYMMRAGRAAEAEGYRSRLVNQRQLEQRAAEERTGPRWGDRFEEHGLGQEELARVVEALQAYHAVGRVYLLRKRVALLPHRPFYILLVKPTTSLRNLDYNLANLLASTVELPSEAFVIPLTWRTYWLLWYCRRFPTARILSRPR